MTSATARIHRNLTWLPPLFALLAYGLSWTYDGVHTLQLVGVALILLLWTGGIALQRFQEGWSPVRLGWAPLFMLAWIIWYALTLIWTTVPYTSWFYFWILGSLPLGFLAWTLTYLGKPESAERGWLLFRAGVFLSALGLVGWALWQYWHWSHTGMSAQGLRPYGPLLDTNSFAAWMNLLFFPALVLWLNHREQLDVRSSRKAQLTSLAGFLFLGLLLIAAFSTDSRGGLLSWLCTWPWILWAFWGRPHIARRLGAVGLLALASFGAFQWSRGFDLVGHLAPSFISKNISTVSRWDMWQSTWHIYLSHPWLGTGLGTYFLYYPMYRLPGEVASAGTYAHNDYLQFLAEGGPISLLFLLLFAAGLFWGAWKLGRELRKPALATTDRARVTEAFGLVLGVFAITGHALGNFIFYNLPLSLLAGLFLARAWQLGGRPATPAPSGPAPMTRYLLVACGLLLLLGPTLKLLENAASRTLVHPQWVVNHLPRSQQVPVLLAAAHLLTHLDRMDPTPFLVLAQIDRQAAHLPSATPTEQKQDWDQAFENYRHALYGIPLQPEVYSEMGALLFKHGLAMGLSPEERRKSVRTMLLTAVNLNPESLALRFNLSTWYAKHGNVLLGWETLAQAQYHPLIGSKNQEMWLEMLRQYQAIYLQRGSK